MSSVTARLEITSIADRRHSPPASRKDYREATPSQTNVIAIRSGIDQFETGGLGRHMRNAPRLDGQVVRMFDLDILDTKIQAAAAWIVDRAKARQVTRVAFVNAHCVNVSCRDRAYHRVLSTADCLLADGSGMAIAARAFGTQLTDNVNGTDLFPLLCERAAASGVGIFLFGGGEGVADKAAARMEGMYPALKVAGTHHGFLKTPDDEARLVDAINASGAQILLVGLGVPFQELWIARNRDRLKPAVLVGVGGLFDYYSDRIPRAPKAFRAVGLEWVWRLAMEPKRLARRYLLGNIEFLARVAWLRLASASVRRDPVPT